MSYRFGEASYWVTVSPGTDSLSLRLSFPTCRRGVFPATSQLQGQKWSTLGEALADNTAPSIKLPCGSHRRTTEFTFGTSEDGDSEGFSEGEEIASINFSTQSWNINKYAADNPVACAELFSRILDAVFEVLVGMPSIQHQRKSFLPGDRLYRRGVFGQPRACASASEVQGRKALHVHMLVWTKLSPAFIQWAVACPPLMQRIEAVIQSHIQTHIPMEYHIDSILDKKRKGKTPSTFRSYVNRGFVPYNAVPRTFAHYQKSPLGCSDRLHKISCPARDEPCKEFQDWLYPFMCFTQVRNGCKCKSAAM